MVSYSILHFRRQYHKHMAEFPKAWRSAEKRLDVEDL